MAEMPTVDSVMQPIITFRPKRRASAIIRRAGVMPPLNAVNRLSSILQFIEGNKECLLLLGPVFGFNVEPRNNSQRSLRAEKKTVKVNPRAFRIPFLGIGS